MIDFLTSDFIGYVLMALLIIVLAFLAYFLLSSITHHIRVSQFFAQYRPSVGIVQRYDKTDDDFNVTMFPVSTGKSIQLMPRMTQALDQYYVLLECQCGGKRFRAAYEIPAEDYGQEQAGVSVQIKDHWNPVGYELL